MDATPALPALLIIDMVKDNFDERRNLPLTPLFRICDSQQFLEELAA